MARFEGIIPAVTTPFTADDQVDVAALKENIEQLIEAGVHGFVATGTMGEAGCLTREERALVVRVRGRGRRRPRAGHGRRVERLAPRSRSSTRDDGKAAGAQYVMSLPPLGYRADADEVVAFYAELATCGLPVMAYNNPEASGVDLPGRPRRAHLRGGRRRRRRQGVLGRHAPHPRAAAPRRRPRGDRRRRRLGARGLRGRRGRLDHGRRRARAARDASSSTTPSADNDLATAREVYRRLLPVARFDMTSKLVQYFKAAPGRRRLQRRPDARAAPAAQARRGRGARRRPRHPARARGRAEMRAARYFAAVDSHTEGMPTRVITGGIGPIPGATMLERKLHFEEHLDELRQLLMREPRGHGAMSGAILQPPAAPGRRLGRDLHRGLRPAADVRARDDRRRDRAGGDRAWSRSPSRRR